MAINPRMDVFQKTEVLARLQHAQFKPPPNPPKRKFILRIYPQIVPGKKFKWTLALIPCLLCFVVFVLSCFMLLAHAWNHAYAWNDRSGNGSTSGIWLILLIVSVVVLVFWIPLYSLFCNRSKKKEIEKIKNSSAYREQCAALNRQYDELEKRTETDFLEQQKRFETETLPQYQRELKEWTRTQNLRIEAAKKDLEMAKCNLTEYLEKNTK